MKKQKLEKYTKEMEELSLQEKRKVEGGRWEVITENGRTKVIWVES